MKYGIIASLAIASIIGVLGLRNQSRLAELTRRLDQQAGGNITSAYPGSPPDGSPSQPAPATTEARTARPARTKTPTGASAAALAIQYLKEYEASTKGAGPEITNRKERFLAIQDELKNLGIAQLRAFMDELMGSEDIAIALRNNVAIASLRNIAADRPQDMLELCKHLPETTRAQLGEMIPDAFGAWAMKDPAAAEAWLGETLRTDPGLISPGQGGEYLVRAMAQDSGKAFELSLKYQVDPMMSSQYIMGAAKTSEQRTSALAGLRAYVGALESSDDKGTAMTFGMQRLGHSFAREGIQAGKDWVKTVNLTKGEFRAMGLDLATTLKPGEQGQWMEWFGSAIPDMCHTPVRMIMSTWADNDYKAAGNWLNTAPPGTMKNEAIHIYAREVSVHEPDAAAQWGTTLPEGELRDKTLHLIYHNWVKQGTEEAKAAAKAFAIQHRVKNHEEGQEGH